MGSVMTDDRLATTKLTRQIWDEDRTAVMQTLCQQVHSGEGKAASVSRSDQGLWFGQSLDASELRYDFMGMSVACEEKCS